MGCSQSWVATSSVRCAWASPNAGTPSKEHTALSITRANSVPIQDITDTTGHKSTHVTETVYRKVIVPTIRGGATVMDTVFGNDQAEDG
jgi:hypothetical protein